MQTDTDLANSLAIDGSDNVYVTGRSIGNGANYDYATIKYSQTPTNIYQATTELPEKYSLLQNYPNPFNPTTKISWQSPVSSHQLLKVYDVLGREVATLVNEYRYAGSYEVEFDAGNLASGIYYYQLKVGDPSSGSPKGQAGQGFVETRKMILMK